jgi:hypothetical protein
MGIMGSGHLRNTGTGGQKISFQYSLLPNKLMASNVQNARKNVIVMLPVRFAPPGKMGTNPSKLLMKMKKKQVSK